MAKNLVIVESPAKAKTIEKYLGKDFTVRSSYGHIRDLSKDNKAVDIENGFEPNYIVPSDKKKVVSELKALVKKASEVWLATDEDREGEAISWHLADALGLNETSTKRIVFHEITKKAIDRAIQNPRFIDKNLVDAQQARRILDRLVGFELSPVLWRKVKPSLSAGRVQSVSVRLIVEREREITAFKATDFFKVNADFATGQDKFPPLSANLNQQLPDAQTAEDFLTYAQQADFKVESVEKKPGKRTPAAPFTTSSMQQEASRKLSFSVSKTMTMAQKLYEAGHITYMRTDSVNLSEDAIAEAKAEVSSRYGAKYSKPRRYKGKSQNAQEAHEAIRPTNMSAFPLKGVGRDESRLYELIWKRTLASQMADAQLEKTNIKIELLTDKNSIAPNPNPKFEDAYFKASGEIIVFDGFLKVYIESKDEEEENDDTVEGLLPPLKNGDALDLILMQATQRFKRPPARYTEASLVKKLEELGIGRPSTYAPTISTIQKRGYVQKEDRPGVLRKYQQLTLSPEDGIAKHTKEETTGAEKSKLFPSNIGMVVNDFLTQHFEKVMDYNFTAQVEKEFDEIASGKLEWRKMLGEFYSDFHPSVEKTLENADRAKGDRELGMHPTKNKPIYAKIGRYGPYVQLGENEDVSGEKPQYASMRDGQLIENITLEEALDLFKLPRNLGTFEDKDLVVNIGRFGPYVRHDGKFVSIPKDSDPYSIEKEEAIALVKEKRIQEAKKRIHEYEHEGKPLKVLNGRYGPYIQFDKGNYKIPKDQVAEELTLDDCVAIVSDESNKSGGRKKRKAPAAKKKTTAKKTTTKKKTAAKKSSK